MKFTFKVGESLKKSWDLYKENFNSMILLVVVVFAVQLLSQFFSGENGNALVSIMLAIANFFLSYLWIRATINLLDNKGFHPFSKDTMPKFSQLWDFFKTGLLVVICMLPFFIIPFGLIVGFAISQALTVSVNVSILIGIIVLAIIFMIPAAYISSRLFIAKYLSVEKCQGARKSVRESWLVTKNNGWIILWKMMLIGLFMGLGFVAFIVGSLITYPVGMIALVMMYRDIIKLNQTEENVTSVSAEQKEVIVESAPVIEQKVSEENK